MDREEELFYLIALSQIKGIGPAACRKLVQHFGNARNVFDNPDEVMTNFNFAYDVVSDIKNRTHFARASQELDFIAKNNVSFLLFFEDDFPYRLNACSDAPPFLFYKGKNVFNPKYSIAVVGTRRATEYGLWATENIIDGLKNYPVQIISGLAFGIDICAHNQSIKNQMSTLGVVAHGLNRIYPWQHAETAEKMQQNGAVVTEFLSGTEPERENFPKRNRIISGMADGVLVVESSEKGGSLITAELAWSYNREVMAVPGSIFSDTSKGCNKLISRNKAMLVTSAEDIVEYMNFKPLETHENTSAQLQIFGELTEEEQTVVNAFPVNSEIFIDEIGEKTGFSPSKTAAILLNLELNGIVKSLPGKRYRLI
ncbi:MAG: DNA-protecting protein DprA [Bacteroidetes bacterium]|nr:MAG: DNA-protecting protein DprA [Bacteroidota bacterium]